jgi:hypothetical protein
MLAADREPHRPSVYALADGSLDYPRRVLVSLEFVVAGVRSSRPASGEPAKS